MAAERTITRYSLALPRMQTHLAILRFLIIAAASQCILTGCRPAETSRTGSAGEVVAGQSVLRIGYQKSSALLNLLRTQGLVERRLGPAVRVVWLEFAAGPQMLEALNVGSVDFGTSGEAPPIFAQAAGAPMLYVALERVGPAAEAIVVRSDAAYQSLAELKGKRIALNKASNVHYFLVRALEGVGLEYADIDPVFLPPADARVAFESGRVDAWAIWDPFLSAAIESGQARVLINGTGIVENYQYYLATRRLADEQPQVVTALIDELRSMNQWAESHRDEVAAFLTNLLKLEPNVLHVAERRRLYGIESIKPETVLYQQRIADTFFRLGLLPQEIRVADAVWNPQKSGSQ